ncbi:aldolase/citrate lyase family protein [soil metagenome]
MAPTPLRTRLATGAPFYFSWSTIPGAVLAGQLARMPFEGVCIDMQHGLAGFTDVATMAPAIAAVGKPVIIRALWNEPGLIGQVLDAGASAVIVPMINTGKEAAALVKAAKYPPMGMRSWGGYAAVQTAAVTPKDYLSQANTLTMIFAMIETEEALDNLKAIAATPGLDGLFVGPNDLGISLGLGLGADLAGPKMHKALKKVVAAATDNGLVPGAFGGSPDACRHFADVGFRFMAAATDINMLNAGAKHLQPG